MDSLRTTSSLRMEFSPGIELKRIRRALFDETLEGTVTLDVVTRGGQ